jgi:hypothetical protein
MHRGYTITTNDLEKVLCLTAGHDDFVLSSITSTNVLNKALCVQDLTEAKSILHRLMEMDCYKDLVSDCEVNNIARLYNKFY